MICIKKSSEIGEKLAHIVYFGRKVYKWSDKVRHSMTKNHMNYKITVRFDREFIRVIESTCSQHHYKKSEFVREAIREFLKKLSNGGTING